MGERLSGFRDEEFLPLSGLQHMVFCDRRAALIHVEGIWLDNSFTVEGSHLHRTVDEGGGRIREGVRIVRGVPLVSQRLGLSGKADVIEFEPLTEETAGLELPPLPGRWRPVPVEYKRGRPKAHRADEVQICAQAMCLEEELELAIPEGRLFYGASRRRHDVRFTLELRDLTEGVARAFHALVRTGTTPVRYRETKCERCSLLPICLPPTRRTARSARAFLDRWVATECCRG